MGLYDRDYTQADYGSGGSGGPRTHMRMGMPRPAGAVLYLLVANIVIFFVGLFIPDNIYVSDYEQMDVLAEWFSVYPYSVGAALQLWRLVTYQFLHGGPYHLLFNMLGLYFLGPTLERHWGTPQFVGFYLGCGIAGGVFYTLLALVGFLPVGTMVGASGAVLGLLAACAILFPHFVVILVLFPVPIRMAALILIFLYVVNVLTRGYNAGGDAAHLAGMAAGAAYVYWRPWLERLRQRSSAGAWQRKAEMQRKMQFEVDRILKKVSEQGIHSLTLSEKRILKKATEQEQRRGHG